ncbi:MAG: AMP-binding protein, partial [Myxococcales bacterium]|nr:AMP-binding protein [Myxococcales bacterium]
PHAALENLVTAIVPAYGLRPDDRALQYSATAFDTSIEEILGTLARGATLVLRSKEDSRSFGRAFVKWCREQDVSVVSVPTALWHGLARAGEVAAFPECVRTVIIGSERALPDALEAWSASAPAHVGLINGYGPTEATVTATCWRLDTPSSGLDTVPIGRPLAGVRAYVLDRYLAPVPVGHPGELCIGGAGVARGYHARPGSTAERFVPDPFGPPGARLYRTGDRVRWRRDGHLEYLGRQDEQLKIRGYRVEPGEVEAALSSLPGVEGCVVGSWGEGDAERLCAWVAGPGATDPSALRRGLAAALPEYMVPGAFVALDALPLTPNGKLDRRALPAPVLSVGEGADPATRSESHLAALFCELLGVDRAGREDDFFALGGHSLLAARLSVRVRDALGVELPLRTVFESPTLEGLAARIDELIAADADGGLPAVERVPRDGPLPLTFGQERLWFLERLEPGTARYTMPVALHIQGALEVATLGRALSAL